MKINNTNDALKFFSTLPPEAKDKLEDFIKKTEPKEISADYIKATVEILVNKAFAAGIEYGRKLEREENEMRTAA